jgi:hypothetical protein
VKKRFGTQPKEIKLRQLPVTILMVDVQMESFLANPGSR